MKVTNSIYPTESQIQGFLEPGPEPIYMVNLLRFRDRAQYRDGRPSELTGEQAYAIYAEGVSRLVEAFGGSVVFQGDVQRLMLGEVEDLWDKVAIAMYPSRQAMLSMMQAPEMAALAEHREAGLAGQLNIETAQPAASVA